MSNCRFKIMDDAFLEFSNHIEKTFGKYVHTYNFLFSIFEKNIRQVIRIKSKIKSQKTIFQDGEIFYKSFSSDRNQTKLIINNLLKKLKCLLKWLITNPLHDHQIKRISYPPFWDDHHSAKGKYNEYNISNNFSHGIKIIENNRTWHERIEKMERRGYDTCAYFRDVHTYGERKRERKIDLSLCFLQVI